MIRTFTYSKTTSLGFIALIVLFYAIPVARGYVLPGPYLVDMLARHLDTTQTLLVEQRQLLFGVLQNGQEQEIAETLRYRFPLSLRSDISTAVAQRVYIQQGDRHVTVLDGRAVNSAANRLDFYRDLLLARSRTHLRNRLTAAGIDIELSSLGHDGSQVVYVLGASFPDMTPAQLWVDKQRFLPVRWILYPTNAAAGVQQVEFRYLSWERLEGQLWYPKRVECYQDRVLVREIIVKSAHVNEPFSDALFSVEQFGQAQLQPVKKPVAESEPHDLEEVQKTIEDFKKIYR